MSAITIDMPRLHDKQKHIKQTAARFNVVNCGRRFGKNVLCHDMVLHPVLRGGPVAWGSPTYKNLGDDWRTLLKIMGPIIENKSEQDKRIQTKTGGVVEMWSLDAPEPIRGRHYQRWIVNEAASVKALMSVWNEILRPTLIDLKGDAFFPSTPKGRNDYYKLYSLGMSDDPEWRSFHYTSYDNPFLDPDELDALRSTLTEREYRQEILAEFLEGEGVVFRYLEGVMIAPVTAPQEHREHTIAVGVDWGKQDDFTAISVGCVDCQREVAIDRFNQIDYAFQRQRLMRLCKDWGVSLVVAEKNAMGEPIIEQLQRDGLRVEGFTTTRVSKAPLIEGLALAIEKRDIQLLPDEYWMMELEAYERTEFETTTKYAAPEGMHDDTVMARALMYSALQKAPKHRREYKQQTQRAVTAIRGI